jgi:hypothetical protein
MRHGNIRQRARRWNRFNGFRAAALLLACGACDSPEGATGDGAVDAVAAGSDSGVTDATDDAPIDATDALAQETAVLDAPDATAVDVADDATPSADAVAGADLNAAVDADPDAAPDADVTADADAASDADVAADAGPQTCSDNAGCATNQHCASGICAPDICVKDAWACHEGQSSLCNSDGSGLVGVTVDCASQTTACAKSVCNSGVGKCVFLLDLTTNGAACSDGDACTQGDTCKDGACVGGSPIVCDDGNPCTVDACVLAVGCTTSALDGVACELDGSACTSDSCLGGVCLPGAPSACEDGNACTVGSCAPETGACSQEGGNEGAACDADGSICTQNDVCQGGMCIAGAPLLCDDGNPCTNDTCALPGGCGHSAGSGGCDDGDPCTLADACTDSACAGLPGPATACDDNNPCTDDSCVAKQGCLHLANTATCTDADPCTDADFCKDSQCHAGAGLCVCEKNSDCAALDDGNPCNGSLFCDLSAFPYQCAVNPKTVITCPASPSICQAFNCDVSDGQCKSHNLNEGSTCDADGTVCTAGDTCGGGVCVVGVALDCDDGNPCTSDACDAVKGCTHTAIAGTCDADGDLCTVGDQCLGSVCVAGTKKVCNDANTCTTDVCDAKTGLCVYTSLADGKPCFSGQCSSGDQCAAGVCKPGPAFSCADAYPCTYDSCNTTTGLCTHLSDGAKACDDGDKCTTDSCLFACTHVATLANCADNDVCTTDACSANTCSNQILPNGCSDGNACTLDYCVGGKGCQHTMTPGPCTDFDACTTGDTCSGGFCTSKPLVCNDGDACTTDSCSSLLGCQTTVNAAFCDDKNACTTDSCVSPGGGCLHVALADCCTATADCADTTPCTLDTCKADHTCSHENSCCMTSDDCVHTDAACWVGTCGNGACSYAPSGACCVADLWHNDLEAPPIGGMTLVNSVSASQGWQYAKPSLVAKSGTGTLYYGDPAAGNYNFGTNNGTATLPLIQLPSGNSTHLTFALYMDTESGTFYDTLIVTVNGTSLWTKASLIAVKFWQSVNLDLSAFTGQAVTVVFSFDTGDAISNTGKGVFIDDIAFVTNCSSPAVCGDGLCGFGETKTNCPVDCP